MNIPWLRKLPALLAASGILLATVMPATADHDDSSTSSHSDRSSSSSTSDRSSSTSTDNGSSSRRRHHHDSDENGSSSSTSSGSSASVKLPPLSVKSAPATHAAAATKPGSSSGAAQAASTTKSTNSDNIPDYGGRDSLLPDPNGAGVPGLPAVSPVESAWHAFEALVVVLALVFGALILIKRYNLAEPLMKITGARLAKGVDGSRSAGANVSGQSAVAIRSGWMNLIGNKIGPPADRTADVDRSSSAAARSGTATVLQLVASRSLPGPAPASVHVLDVDGRRFLIGAAGVGVTLLADWDVEEVADDAPSPEPASAQDERFEAYLNRMGMTSETPTAVVEERVKQSTGRLQAVIERARADAEALSPSAGRGHAARISNLGNRDLLASNGSQDIPGRPAASRVDITL